MSNTSAENGKPLTEEEKAEIRQQKIEEQEAAHEEAAAAKEKAAAARAKVEEARVEATKAEVKPEHQAYYDAVQEADDAEAEAAEKQRQADAKYVETDEKPFGDAGLPKGNIPANPKDAGGIQEEDKNEVHLSRQTADGEVRHMACAKVMAGDYERAGWNIDPIQPSSVATDSEEAAPKSKSKKAKAKDDVHT